MNGLNSIQRFNPVSQPVSQPSKTVVKRICCAIPGIEGVVITALKPTVQGPLRHIKIRQTDVQTYKNINRKRVVLWMLAGS